MAGHGRYTTTTTTRAGIFSLVVPLVVPLPYLTTSEK